MKLLLALVDDLKNLADSVQAVTMPLEVMGQGGYKARASKWKEISQKKYGVLAKKAIPDLLPK